MATAEQVLFGIEDALQAERLRLTAEAASFEAVRLGECAAALAVVGPTTAFFVGVERICRAADFIVQAETRRDALLTAIDAVEGSVSRLPSIQDLLQKDPQRAGEALEIMLGVVKAAKGISGVSDFLDDSVELLEGIARDAREKVPEIGWGIVEVLGAAAAAALVLRFAMR